MSPKQLDNDGVPYYPLYCRECRHEGNLYVHATRYLIGTGEKKKRTGYCDSHWPKSPGDKFRLHSIENDALLYEAPAPRPVKIVAPAPPEPGPWEKLDDALNALLPSSAIEPMKTLVVILNDHRTKVTQLLGELSSCQALLDEATRPEPAAKVRTPIDLVEKAKMQTEYSNPGKWVPVPEKFLNPTIDTVHTPAPPMPIDTIVRTQPAKPNGVGIIKTAQIVQVVGVHAKDLAQRANVSVKHAAQKTFEQETSDNRDQIVRALKRWKANDPSLSVHRSHDDKGALHIRVNRRIVVQVEGGIVTRIGQAGDLAHSRSK